ncbi:hypothetical protein [Nocardia sp. NBC_00416]|uniref:hypothetical protein n=1 Tax=Nocardia sp. NBC_00416 TaxID=2975991 RepID=UPI002E1A4283
MPNRTLIVLLVCAALCCCCGGGLVSAVLSPLGEITSLGSSDLQRQCNIAIGSPTDTTTPTATPATTTATPSPESVSPSPRPTANPYAASTAPDATGRHRACVAAMNVAPYQDQDSPLRQANTGRAVACAADIAQRYPDVGGTADTAVYLRDVIYSASAVVGTGQCVPTRAPQWVAEGNCGDPRKRVPAVVLPMTIREQGYCGLQVDPSVASPGDLVFWDFHDNGATRAGIALGPHELVTAEGGKFVRLSMPEGVEVYIKRVLGEVT